jgi:DNA-binding MarR family transcriptional regulator
MKDSPLLRELKARRHELEAERAAVRAEIALEQERLKQEEARYLAGLETNVRARWEAEMTVADIAKVLHCTPKQVTQILDGWREREQVKVRRGRTIPERRRILDKRLT